MVRNFHRTDIGERNPDVFSLAPGEAAVHVRISVKSRSGVTSECFECFGCRVRVVAQRPLLPFAEKAVAARDGERNNHAVADLKVHDIRTDLNHLTHELMTEDIAGFHSRDESVVEMKIRAAYRRRRDFYYCVSRVKYLRVGNTLDPHIVFSKPAKCFHRSPFCFESPALAAWPP